MIDFDVDDDVKSELQAILKANFEIIVVHVINDVTNKMCN